MPISEMMVLRSWEKAGGRCECSRWSHSHTYVRCARLLKWDMRNQSSQGGWVPSFHTSFSSGEPLSCEILCLNCYQRVQAADFIRR
jgi:hypothetical protein